jgi:hypothetical protein
MNIKSEETQVDINYFGERCKLKVSKKLVNMSDRKRHTFVSMSLPHDPEDVQFQGITERPEYTRKGENLLVDKQWRVYNKAELKMQKDVIDMAVHSGLFPRELANEIKFSRTYLCSCGCSPGWVSRDYRRTHWWIEVVSPRKVQEREEWFKDYKSQQEERTLESMVI